LDLEHQQQDLLLSLLLLLLLLLLLQSSASYQLLLKQATNPWCFATAVPCLAVQLLLGLLPTTGEAPP
jgi:hypothetical protein